MARKMSVAKANQKVVLKCIHEPVPLIRVFEAKYEYSQDEQRHRNKSFDVPIEL